MLKGSQEITNNLSVIRRLVFASAVLSSDTPLYPSSTYVRTYNFKFLIIAHHGIRSYLGGYKEEEEDCPKYWEIVASFATAQVK